MDNFVKSHFVGRDGFVWWIGQIPNEDVWKENKAGYPQPNNTDAPGFAERYKVRIMGYHTGAMEDLKDEELPWATVMYPVTAGGGGRASYQNANLTQGCFVFGFFLDGDQCQVPVIMGALGYNDYQAVKSTLPQKNGFLPITGYTEKETIKSVTTVKAEEDEGIVAKQDNEEGKSNNANLNESTEAGSSQTDIGAKNAAKDGAKKKPLEVPERCRPLPTSKMQQTVQNLMLDVQELKRAKFDRQSILITNAADIDAAIQKKVKEASEVLSGSMKQILGQVQKNATEKINDKLKDTYYNVFPNARQELKKEVETINDAIACQFRNLADGLMDMLGNFLNDAINKVVNTASCFIDNMIGAMMGTLANAIGNSLSDLFGNINGLTGGSISFPSSEALGIIQDVLSFLACDQDPTCPQVTETSLLGGGSSTPSSSDIGSLAGGFSNMFGKLKAPQLDLPNLNFGDVFGANSCDTGPTKCGPPLLDIFGGRGRGAVGNLIVSSLGEILGADMKSFGKSYDNAVDARVVDPCGIGRGASIEPIVGPWIDGDGNTHMGVLDIRVVQPGIDYLGQPDGSTGGDGRVWAKPDDTSITHANGDVEIPRAPGTILTVVPGDTVLMPPGTEITTEPLSPADVQEITATMPDIGAEIFRDGVGTDEVVTRDGGVTTGVAGAIVDLTIGDQDGLSEIDRLKIEQGIGIGGDEKIKGGIPFVITKSGKFTTPARPVKQESGIYPTSSTGAYPAILTLCEVFIDSPGYGYSEEDTIVIEPNAGATVVPTFNDIGSLMSVKITDGGQGFTEMPDVYLKSETGFNAVLLPKFCVERIAKDELVEYQPSQDKLVSIVDCVGVVPPPQRTLQEPGVTRRAYADADTGFTPPTPIRIIGAGSETDETTNT